MSSKLSLPILPGLLHLEETHLSLAQLLSQISVLSVDLESERIFDFQFIVSIIDAASWRKVSDFFSDAANFTRGTMLLLEVIENIDHLFIINFGVFR